MIRPGSFTIIKFRNPFDEPTKFIVKTEPSSFKVDAQNLTVKSKTLQEIKVSLNLSKEQEMIGNYPVTGKLTVTVDQCTCPNLCDTKWVFYLQSIM